ncbi:DUF3141 domain-containing protein [Chitinilyticum litopenaei]|uniref:DUF3141 domain-containing protein n=1 Tax=Chitinilyticum litopenaei TaxID=1121276 RepID=UPI0004172125|nr:DUF3141 domain-containing protein [Chitinilyticum litopenaei]
MWLTPEQWHKSCELQSVLSRRFQERWNEAGERLFDSSKAALASLPQPGTDPQRWLQDGVDYLRDSTQRQTLFWDVLRQRGDQYLQHEAAGKPPVLHFDYEIVQDGRSFMRPVNYALVRIVPPKGSASVDPQRRPYVIIDPRAGHGPGIGGFKQDSEVGMALKDAHPVYCVIFFPEPEPGQTLADVTLAEQEFLRFVAREHPDAPKPVLVGNCQGGWAAMLVAATAPDLVGAVVVNGAPVSYWAGNDNNPMRYAGGMLGGSWPALLASDLGNGKFDGAHLVANFETLDLGNTLVGKSYNLYDKIDTEPPRFLEFERWWSGYFLMNEEEIRWIVENLFVGNNLVEGKAASAGGMYDLKAIHAPIVVFASLGDNITPPQQAFNWILDLYPSTDALKAAGQVVVGLMHQSVGHLGIFVSAGVATKEHAQIVELMKVIESLPPGLYAMKITEETHADGSKGWSAELSERRVEDLKRGQEWQRKDEIPFSAVESVSELNARAYQMLVRPWLRPLVSEQAALLTRFLHPNRSQRWSWTSLNPAAAAVGALADTVREHRQPASIDNPWRQWERLCADQLAAGLDFLGNLRDLSTEALFYQQYGLLAIMGIGAENRPANGAGAQPEIDDAALARQLADGGEVAGMIRMGLILAQQQDSISVRTRQFSLEWLRQQPQFAQASDEEIRTQLRLQSQLLWRLPEAARASLPGLFASNAALEAAFDVYARLAELAPAKREELATLLHVLRQEISPATTPAAPAAPAAQVSAAAEATPVTTTAAPPATAPAVTAASTKEAAPATAKPRAPRATSTTRKPATRRTGSKPENES